METILIPGEGPDFVAFIHGQNDKARIEAIEGKFRWVITREDGTEYIARPQHS
jgi:hypothetical protein